VDPISIALGLAKLAPMVAGWLGGEDAEKTAVTVVNAAKQIAGVEDPQDALTQIENDPELKIKFQQAMLPLAIARLENESKQLAEINATMRVEAKSNDGFVRRWRPFFGYTVAITWLIQMTALGILIVAEPKAAPAVISAMAELSMMWGVALSILGISVSKRSQDKALAAGKNTPPGLIQSITQQWLKK